MKKILLAGVALLLSTGIVFGQWQVPQNNIPYGRGTGTGFNSAAAAANSTLVTNGSNVPSLSQTLPNAVQDNITRLGTVGTGSIAASLLSGTVSCARFPALTGDLTSSAGACATTLATVNGNVGTFGSATSCVVATANAKGLITAISGTTCAPLATSVASPAALTTVNDTNVTATLGGTPTTSLLRAVSLTLGWTGQLSPAKGGTGANNTATSNRYLKGDGTNFVTSSGNAAGTGGCSAGQFVTAANSDAPPTCGIPAGGGDVLGPATNSADFIPQWNGANSKTLKNGVTPANGIEISGSNLQITAARRTTPTTQKFTSGSGTYTTPANVLWIRVRMVGGGGGGAGGGTGSPGNGTNGNASTWSGGSLSAGGGFGGVATIGGQGAVNSGTVDISIGGGDGDGGHIASGTNGYGGLGGSSFFGGAGSQNNGAKVNSGSGGAGGLSNSTAANLSGGGGGSGGYIEHIIGSPAATYLYAVGASALGGAAGTNGGAGTDGASGFIIIEEHYGS